MVGQDDKLPAELVADRFGQLCDVDTGTGLVLEVVASGSLLVHTGAGVVVAVVAGGRETRGLRTIGGGFVVVQWGAANPG